MGEKQPVQITNEQELKQFVEENLHKVRSCYEYYDEHTECTRIKGRFHQYFIFGELLDCSSWKSDLVNCEKARKNKDKYLKEIASIIQHEDERKEQRLKNHLQNDVWPRRTAPPDNWNSPLPEWMREKEEFRERMIPRRQCVIS